MKFCPICHSKLIYLSNLFICPTVIAIKDGFLSKSHYQASFEDFLKMEFVYTPNYYIEIYHDIFDCQYVNEKSTLIFKIKQIAMGDNTLTDYEIMLDLNSNKILNLTEDIEKRINFLLTFS